MIRNAVAALTEFSKCGLPWLIVGKGPTLAKLTPKLAATHILFTLNHALKVVPRPCAGLVAHFTDLEALDDCIPEVGLRRPRLVIPWHPHVKMEPGFKTLDDYAASFTARGLLMDDLRKAGDLWSYNSDRAGTLSPNRDLTSVRVRKFSSVPAFNLLALAGVKEIFTLGIDGGTAYDPRMDAKDKLANGQPSFDVQLEEIGRTLVKNKIQWVPL